MLIEIVPDKDDQILPGGPITLKTLTPDHLIVIADALSKSVVLARDEREVTAVFELTEPFARQLAERGRAAAGRRTILKHIGNALLVQHRVSGGVAVAEKPDVVWDRPDLDRLYARLEDEYELKERAEALTRKLAVIADTAEVLTDIIDTKRSFRLEIIIVDLDRGRTRHRRLSDAALTGAQKIRPPNWKPNINCIMKFRLGARRSGGAASEYVGLTRLSDPAESRDRSRAAVTSASIRPTTGR